MSNSFSVFASPEAMKDFIKSTIKSCDIVLEHYDFVINDISSNISNPVLETSKKPTIEFLKAMRQEWQKAKDESQKKLNSLK